jgi:small-conductance mechanosensitive channel
MKMTVAKLLGLALLALLSVFSSTVPAFGLLTEKQKPAAVQAAAPAEPILADIIPQAADLSARLASLEGSIQALPPTAPVEREIAHSEARLEGISEQLERLKHSKEISYAPYVRLRANIEDEQLQLAGAIKPLADDINLLDKWGKEWRSEKARWSGLQSSVIKDHTGSHLRASIESAIATIDTARGLVTHHLDGLMALQARGAAAESRAKRLASEMRILIEQGRHGLLSGEYAPMYSRRFIDQFRNDLWSASRDEFALLTWPNSRFFSRHLLAFTLLSLLMIAITALVYRNRQALVESKRWQFVGEMYISTGLFACALILAFLARFWEAPSTLIMANLVVGGIACARLVGGMLKQTWQKQAAYGVIIVYLAAAVLLAANLPVPIYRIYILMVTLLGFVFCMRWSKESSRQNEPGYYARLLRLVATWCAVIMIAQFLGEAGIAGYLFVASLITMVIILALLLFTRLIRGGLHWVFFSSPLWQVKLMRNEASDHARQFANLINAAIVAFVLIPAVLAAWGVFTGYPEALSGLLEPGFSIGTQRISVAMVLAAAGTLYGSLLAASIVSKLVFDDSFAGKNMERGVQLSSARLLQYFIILVGFLLALALVGIDWTNLTIMLGALGVGIGFGLQSIVNNFVSGLILLFEHPLREGDTIEIAGKERVHIKKIGLRSTRVQTFELADVIIPNADLITNAVTNWTLGNRQGRLSVPVGVAYGSDVGLVSETLLTCAKQNEKVVSSPAPQVLFMNLGESSLDFELRVWIKDADARVLVRSQLYYDILQKFRELNIEIPFPQRDLHVRSVDDSADASVPLLGAVPGGKPA